MRALILVAGAVLTLSACNANDADNESLNVDNLAVENLVVNDPAAMNGVTTDANGVTNSDTANLVVEDLTTNDADTNLANGM